jgi:hypothetical protein
MSNQGHQHEHDDHHRSLEHYAADFLENWRDYEGSLATKLRLLARNRSRAFTVGKGCCGHPGEPGC